MLVLRGVGGELDDWPLPGLSTLRLIPHFLPSFLLQPLPTLILSTLHDAHSFLCHPRGTFALVLSAPDDSDSGGEPQALAALTPVHALGLAGIAPYMGSACKYIVFGTSEITTGESGHFGTPRSLLNSLPVAYNIPP